MGREFKERSGYLDQLLKEDESWSGLGLYWEDWGQNRYLLEVQNYGFIVILFYMVV